LKFSLLVWPDLVLIVEKSTVLGQKIFVLPAFLQKKIDAVLDG
jgi:hypothetical protein